MSFFLKFINIAFHLSLIIVLFCVSVCLLVSSLEVFQEDVEGDEFSLVNIWILLLASQDSW